MHILVLGGSQGVGRLIADALRPAHDVAVDDLTADCDTVIDAGSEHPDQVRRTVAALGDRVGRYVFLSSTAVLDGAWSLRRPPLAAGSGPLTPRTYGPALVACEDVLTRAYGPRLTLVRVGDLAGDDLRYWADRVTSGGRVGVPGSPEQPVQLLDARDLAGFVARLAEDDTAGTYVAAGPPTTLGAVIEACAEAVGATVELVPAPPAEAPLVRPVAHWPVRPLDPAAGLKLTPLAETVASILAR